MRASSSKASLLKVPLLESQAQYLGGELPVDKYTFLLYHNLNTEEDGYMGVPDQAAYIGMKGKSLSDLRPSGTVGIVIEDEEIRLDCIAESGYIEEGHPVVITEQRGPALVVRLAD